jgi:hypothetical protein
MDAMDSEVATSVATQADLVEELRERQPEHPALARLHQRMVNSEDQQITSYDRMHHRHNRS